MPTSLPATSSAGDGGGADDGRAVGGTAGRRNVTLTSFAGDDGGADDGCTVGGAAGRRNIPSTSVAADGASSWLPCLSMLLENDSEVSLSVMFKMKPGAEFPF